jgi:hypothetical protein
MVGATRKDLEQHLVDVTLYAGTRACRACSGGARPGSSS